MKKIICILAVMLLLTGCAAGNGIGFDKLQSSSPAPEVVEMTSVTATPVVTFTPSPTPSATPSPTPRLYGRLSSMTLKESIDELISLGADITNIVEYDEAAAANSAMGKLEAYTQRIDFTLNGKVDCVAETYDSVDAATARADYYTRISETAAIGAYIYQFDMTVIRIKKTATPEEAEIFRQLLVQVDQ
ncbi:MAG: hypothetical protein C0413_04560 [Clostridiales bacterium]|nr:hypothetical protein [Clostridiales bacterium]